MSLKTWISGLSTKVLNFLLRKDNNDFKNTFGLSFNPNIKLKTLPTKLPNVNEFYKVANDLSFFEVISVDEKKKKIKIREICTDNEIELFVEPFDLLFIKEENVPEINIK